MTRQEAEDLVYRSYLRAAPLQPYGVPDAQKRHPELTRELLWKGSGTACALVTGSKGKGSTAKMAAELLQARLCTGLMTSPHLTDFCERFRVNARQISDAEFIREMEALEPELAAAEEGLPKDVCISPVGIQALVAQRWFQKQGTQFNLYECGKGVQYDDVGNIPHEYALISSIFAEHTRELGSTLREIAADKAHVITGGQRCIFAAAQEPEVQVVLEERAARFDTPLFCYGRDFLAEDIRFTPVGMQFDVRLGVKRYPGLKVPLLGEHQARNAALALALAAEVLPDLGPEEARERLAAVDWPGRMEVLSSEPFVLLDACIHTKSTEAVREVLEKLGIREPAVLIGIPDDKDFAGVARGMARTAGELVLTRSRNPHYRFTPKWQQERLALEGIRADRTDSVEEALERALHSGRPVVILGTTSVVSEVKALSR